MLLKRRPLRIEDQSPEAAPGYARMPREGLAVLAWLDAGRIDYVLVGSLAETAREMPAEPGPAAIVPAPYLRNLERLTQALLGAGARTRVGETVGSVPPRLSPDRLMADGSWSLRCGGHDLDVETRTPFRARYQELLYEAQRFELASGLSVQVAGVVDLERYARLHRGRRAPEIRISRVPAPAAPLPGSRHDEVAPEPPRLALVPPS